MITQIQTQATNPSFQILHEDRGEVRPALGPVPLCQLCQEFAQLFSREGLLRQDIKNSLQGPIHTIHKHQHRHPDTQTIRAKSLERKKGTHIVHEIQHHCLQLLSGLNAHGIPLELNNMIQHMKSKVPHNLRL